VLFDELERIAKFSLNQRTGRLSGAGLVAGDPRRFRAALSCRSLPMTEEFLDNYITGGKRDAQNSWPRPLGQVSDEREQRASRGIQLLTSYSLLDSPNAQQTEENQIPRQKSL